MEIISNNKGSDKLLYEGFSYTKKYKTKSTFRWECSNRSSHNCKGTITTDLAVTEMKSNTSHTHEADPFRIAALKVKAEIKAGAQANRGKPGQIITDKLFGKPKEVKAATGEMDSLTRMVRRAKKGNTPKNPDSIEFLNPCHKNTEQHLQRKIENFSFMVTSSLQTDIGLELLSNSDTWFMDGTHSTCPSQFSQLFVVRVPLGVSHVSAVYALLSSKHQSDYEECLTAIFDTCLHRNLRPNPSTIVADYEITQCC